MRQRTIRPSSYNLVRRQMSRREFLARSSAASMLPLLHACGGTAMTPPTTNGFGEKIVVIGAGVAGLSAAQMLDEIGYEVVVLEARNRLGGRIWTDRSLGLAIDLGASWIQGTIGNPITDIANDLGIERFETNFDSLYLYDSDGALLQDADADEVAAECLRLQENSATVVEAIAEDISQLELTSLANDGRTFTEEQNWCIATLEAAAAEELSNLSAFYAGDDDGFDGGSELFPGGYDQVPSGIAEGLDIRFQHIVSQITYSQDGVVVETDRGDFEADRAVVTLPLGVLKAGSVAFLPALPESKQGAINRLAMGTLNKVVMRFPTSFWQSDRHFLAHISETKGEFPEFLNARLFSDEPVLMAFTAGDYARELEDIGQAEAIDRAMAVLQKIYGTDIPDPEEAIVANWASDPFAYGSYSHVPLGATSEDFDLLAESVDNRLFFAGEATNRQFRATVHGAYLSGVREAEKIVALS